MTEKVQVWAAGPAAESDSAVVSSFGSKSRHSVRTGGPSVDALHTHACLQLTADDFFLSNTHLVIHKAMSFNIVTKSH